MIIDAQQRQLAIEPNQSFIVQAPAGSGKTELLIQRYLKLLSLVESPEEIIAITFTKKAASEMQSRVLSALDKSRNNIASTSEHELLTQSLAKAALARDKQFVWNLEENPNRLRIQTIDSLCANLCHQMPMLAQLGARAETIDDPIELFEQAVTNVINQLEKEDAWSDDVARLLIYLDNDVPRLKKLLIQMLYKRDQWIRYVVSEHNRDDMEDTLKHIIESHLMDIVNSFPADMVAELCELSCFAAEQLQITNPEHIITECTEMKTLPGSSWQDLKQWQALRTLLLTDKADWRIQLTKKIGFPAPSEKKSEQAYRKSMKERMQNLLSSMHDFPELKIFLSQIDYLPSEKYESNDWEIIGSMIKLLRLAEAELRLIFSSQNKLDFTAVSQAAITALGEEEAPTDLALYLDHKINHLLVDEFQDISINQYVLLNRLIAGWSNDEANSVFLVGDPMQSIYRFREAEVGIFIQTWQQQRINQIQLKPLRLELNFRSSQAIVNWVNQRFKSIMPIKDNVEQSAVCFNSSTAYDLTGNESDINFHALLNRSDTEEANNIVNSVKEILQTNENDTVAILVQSRSHLRQILPTLKSFNIAFRAVDIEPLANQSHILDLLALTRAYSHLADKVAWLSILRAPWCGLNLNSMTQLFSHAKKHTIWSVLQNPKNFSRLEEQEKVRLERFIIIFKQHLQQKQQRSMHQIIESLWLKLGGPATLEKEYHLEDVQRFFYLLDDYEEVGELANFQDLTNAVDNLYAGSDSNELVRVQIMSMHKSKGLEFDHVFLPGLGKRTNISKDELMKWTMVSDLDEQKMIMAPIKESGSTQNAVYKYLKHIEKTKNIYEDARLLYVACTRAKRSLNLYGHANVREDKNGVRYCQINSNSLMQQLWEYSEPIFNQHLNGEVKVNLAEDVVLIDQRLRRLDYQSVIDENNDEILINVKNPELHEKEHVIEYEWASENIKHIGTIVHRYLQEIAEQGLSNWNNSKIDNHTERFKNQLKLLGVEDKDLHWSSQRIKEALVNVINDDKGKWIMDANHTDAKNELSLTASHNNSIVSIKIDRTFVDKKGTRWIIDYKTSRHEQSDIDTFLDQEKIRYENQLNRYGEIMQQMDTKESNREIRLGLYFPLLRGWREWSI